MCVCVRIFFFLIGAALLFRIPSIALMAAIQMVLAKFY